MRRRAEGEPVTVGSLEFDHYRLRLIVEGQVAISQSIHAQPRSRSRLTSSG
jgi:hypothetical protein